MRVFLFILCFFFLTNSYAQDIELQGRYGASFIGGESIEFVGKDSFYFNGFYCTYGVQGKGRCEIRNNHLYLYFEKSKTKSIKDSAKLPVIKRIDNGDSISEINITCVDNNSVPISYATVQLKIKNKATLGTITDTSGQASFSIKKSEMPIILETPAIGFETRQINIDRYASYNIQIFHAKSDLFEKELNSGEVFVYEIEDLSEDLILMRPEKSRERFRKYRKTK
jgi:hypothetical protein